MSPTKWTRPAQADLARIDDHHRERDVAYADRVGRQAIGAGRFLAQHPASGSPIDHELRKWRVRGTRYLLVYRLVPGGVEVLRVRHERENWRAEPL